MSDTLTTETDDGVHVLTLSRPEKHNALNRELLDGIAAALRAADGDASAVVLRGAGEAFSTGIDLDEAALGTGGGDPELLVALQEASRALFAFDGLTVAALEGHVVGAGLELACGCDLRIAAPDTSFRLPELDLGITLTNGATKTLPELVGRGTATRLILDGGPFRSEEMADAGLVDELDEAPADRARQLGARAAAVSRNALVRTLAAFEADRSVDATLDAEIRDVIELQAGRPPSGAD